MEFTDLVPLDSPLLAVIKSITQKRRMYDLVLIIIDSKHEHKIVLKM